MALADDIELLRDESLAGLDESHDYYTNTKGAWRIVQLYVKQGGTVNIRNQATGSTVQEHELPGLAQKYITGDLSSATLQHFVSLFEDFVFKFLRAWLINNPEDLYNKPREFSERKVDFRTILNCSDKDGIVRVVVDERLASLLYKGIAVYLKYLERMAKIGFPTSDQIEKLAEIKASRDVLVHNGGIANQIYVDKSQGRARFKNGETLDIPENYHRDSWTLIKQVVRDISDAAVNKLASST